MQCGKPRVCILGGGVRGCSIAALLAESGRFAVTLLESQSIGSGMTSLNHGRLHSGSSLWHGQTGETPEQEERRAGIIRRRLRGAELIRQAMPDCFGSAQLGIHLIHPELEAAFADACARYGIPICSQQPDVLVRKWLHPSLANWTAVGVPEYAFLPTELAMRLALFATDSGARILTGHRAQSVTKDGSTFCIALTDQSVHRVDAVVNTAGVGISSIHCGLHDGLDLPLRFSYPEITLLVLRVIGQVPPLNRAITIIEPDQLLPTLIPHSGAFVFHADARVPSLIPPESWERTTSQLGPFDSASRREVALMEACRRFFRPLAQRSVVNQLESVSAVYPRLDHLRPSRPFRVHSMLDKSLYWVVSGGNATSTFVDACDTVETMLASMPGWEKLRDSLPDWLTGVVSGLRVGRPTHLPGGKMVWE